MERVLITGANRGLGLAFARLYLERGAQVFAGARRPEAAHLLEELKQTHGERLTVIPLDVSDEDSICRSRDIVAGLTDSLNLLINNAGIGGVSKATGKQEQLGTLAMDDIWEPLKTMAVGPLLMAQEYLNLLQAAGEATVANVTSGYGSVSSNTTRFPYYYSAAKSALHQLMRSLAADVRQWNIRIVLLDPGSVSTDMGGPNAPLTPEQSAGGMIQVIDSLTLEQSGAFLDWEGNPKPW
jgi:NAD(P)-dependent dehydrogenase (short-subunit alcohol dehydrogenase family)